MVCLGCLRVGHERLCPGCRRGMVGSSERWLPSGVRLMTAFEHTGLAADLVKSLKYRGATGYVPIVAERLIPRIPDLPLVPIPRVLTRLVRFGVDPAEELAIALSRRKGVPVLRLLRRPVHSPHRAGRNQAGKAHRFVAKAPPKGAIVLVDDVVTTGSTVAAAVDALGHDSVVLAVAANDALGAGANAFGSREGTRQP